MIFPWIFMLILAFVLPYARVLGIQYCIMETFNLKCKSNEVIMVTSARYGRMNKGKCLGENAEHLGCVADVLPLLDRICSGQRECTYQVGDEGLVDYDSCDQLKPYLELKHECLTVSPSVSNCKDGSFNELKANEGYIASYDNTNLCGKKWRIHGKPGQRIAITLIDFASKKQSYRCSKKGYLYDVGIKKNVTICGSPEREHQIYTSNGNTLDVQFLDQVSDSREAFVIKYKVLGCADLLPPDHGWHERSGDKAVLGCQHQDVKWHIQCIQDHWQGVVGNCTIGEHDKPVVDKEDNWKLLSDDNFLLIIICCVFGIILLIIIFVLIYITWGKCTSKRTNSHQQQQLANSLPYGQGTGDYVAPGWSTFHHQGRANSMYNPHMPPLLDAPLVEAPPPPQYSQTMSASYHAGQYPTGQNSIYTNLTHPDSTLGSKDYQDPKYYVLDKDAVVDNNHGNLMQ